MKFIRSDRCPRRYPAEDEAPKDEMDATDELYEAQWEEVPPEVDDSLADLPVDDEGDPADGGAWAGKRPRRAGQSRQRKAAPAASAETAALRLLTYRDHSSRMLREKLTERGYPADEIKSVITLLCQKRLINDLRYGENLIRYLAERRYYGRYKIRMELAAVLDREVIDSLLPTQLEQYDFSALAAELLQKPQYRTKSREALIRKLKANGYSAAEIRSALEGDIASGGQEPS